MWTEERATFRIAMVVGGGVARSMSHHLAGDATISAESGTL